MTTKRDQPSSVLNNNCLKGQAQLCYSVATGRDQPSSVLFDVAQVTGCRDPRVQLQNRMNRLFF